MSSSTVKEQEVSARKFPTKVPLYINNETVEPSTGEYVTREDPADRSKTIHQVAKAQRDDVAAAVDAARDAFDHNVGSWVTNYKLRESAVQARRTHPGLRRESRNT